MTPSLPAVSPRDPRAERTLYFRQVLIRRRYAALERYWLIIEEMAKLGADAEEQLWLDACQLFDDAERVARFRKQSRRR
jgi:hypothetical protein